MSTVVGTPPGVTASGYRVTPPIPPTVAGLAAWWDAADTASITASAGSVSQWNDKSGGGRHLIGAPGSQPQTGSATINGKNVIAFSGGPYLSYTGSTGVNMGAFTVFMVIKQTIESNDAGTITAHSGPSSTDYGHPGGFGIPTGGSADWMDGVRNISGDSSRFKIPGTGPTPVGVYVGRASTDGYFRGYMNGGPPFTLAANVTAWTVATGGWVVGARWLNGISSHFGGQIAELIVYSSSLFSTDMNIIGQYLATKWGLSWSTIT